MEQKEKIKIWKEAIIRREEKIRLHKSIIKSLKKEIKRSAN